MTDLTRDKLVEIIARSDAEFDGRPFDGMARADRDRYRERAAKSLAAIAEDAAIVPRELQWSNQTPIDRLDHEYKVMVSASDLSRPAHEEPAEQSQ